MTLPPNVVPGPPVNIPVDVVKVAEIFTFAPNVVPSKVAFEVELIKMFPVPTMLD